MYFFLKKNKFFLFFIFNFSISLVIIPLSFASIGVKVGDWAKYEVTTLITEGSEEFLEELGDIDFEWLKMEVKTVDVTSVTVELTAHLLNGTEETDTVDAQEVGFIVEADLKEGDTILAPYIEEETTIVNTVSREYAGAYRSVNLIQLSSGEGFNTTYQSFFDQKTGIMCELSLSLALDMFGEHYESSLNYKLIETNMFTTSINEQMWFYPAIGFGVFVMAVAILLVYRRSTRGKLPIPPPKPESET
jgi:hypothetical protein